MPSLPPTIRVGQGEGPDRRRCDRRAGRRHQHLRVKPEEFGKITEENSDKTFDLNTGRVVLPVTDGPGVLSDVAARRAASGLRVSDLALRRPTLDDVFLALTGQPTTTPSAPDTAAGRD
jgi:hypothetical protein